MKKLLFGVLALGLLMTACEKDKEDSSSLKVSAESISFTKDASKKSIFIESNVQWAAISSDTTWCKLQPGRGVNSDSLYVTALENDNLTERTANITVTGEGLSAKTIQVKQAATPARLVKEILVDNKVVNVYEYDNLNRIVNFNIAIGGTNDFMRYSLLYAGNDLIKCKYTVDGEADSILTTYTKVENIISLVETFYDGSTQKKSIGKITLKANSELIDRIDYTLDVRGNKTNATFEYDEKGNLTKNIQTALDLSGSNSYIYSDFDTKNGVLSGTSTPKWWLIKMGTPPSVNNQGKKVVDYGSGYGNPINYSYVYDKYGYPVVVDMGERGKYTITYIQAK